MLKKLLLIITLLFISTVQAQHEWTPALVILKNGTSFRGLVKFPKHSGGLISIGSTKFKYKKSRKYKTEKYGKNAVDEVVFGDENFATLHYKYVPINKQKSVLMQLVVRGKATLYSRIVSKSEIKTPSLPDFPNQIVYYDDTQFYIIRNNEEKATLIVDPSSYGGFISIAITYFSDCSTIVHYLENELYELNDIIELVDDYNLLCE